MIFIISFKIEELEKDDSDWNNFYDTLLKKILKKSEKININNDIVTIKFEYTDGTVFIKEYRDLLKYEYYNIGLIPKNSKKRHFYFNNSIVDKIISNEFICIENCYLENIDLYIKLIKLNNLEISKSYFKNINMYSVMNIYEKFSLYKCIFVNSKIDFGNVKFNDYKLDFASTHFYNSNLNFNLSHIESYIIDFCFAQFYNSKIEFLNTIIPNGSIKFLDSYCDELKIKNCSLNKFTELYFNEINNLEISECINSGILRFRYEKADTIKKLSFNKTLNQGTIDIDWNINNVSNGIDNNNDSDISKSKQYAMLKENYHILGDYDAEDKAFVKYMITNIKSRYKNNFILKLVYNIFYLIGGFGTKPLRILNVSIFSIVFFGFIYSYLFCDIVSLKEILSNFSFGIYFSSITFFTIGYGLIKEINESLYFTIVITIEGFWGMFLMSYFTVALVRKTLR